MSIGSKDGMHTWPIAYEIPTCMVFCSVCLAGDGLSDCMGSQIMRSAYFCPCLAHHKLSLV